MTRGMVLDMSQIPYRMCREYDLALFVNANVNGERLRIRNQLQRFCGVDAPLSFQFSNFSFNADWVLDVDTNTSAVRINKCRHHSYALRNLVVTQDYSSSIIFRLSSLM